MTKSYKRLAKELIKSITKSHEVGFDIDNPNIEALIVKSNYAGNIRAMQKEEIDLTDVRYYNIENMLRVIDKFTESVKNTSLGIIPLFYHPEADVYLGVPIQMLNEIEMIDSLCDIDDLSIIDEVSHPALESIGMNQDVIVSIQRPSHHHILNELFGTSTTLDYKASVPYRYFLNLLGFVDVIPTVKDFEDNSLTLTPVMSETMNKETYSMMKDIELYVNIENELWNTIFEKHFTIEE